MKTKSLLRQLSAGGLILLQLNLGFFSLTLRAADEPGVIDRSKAAVKDATTAAEGAAKDLKTSVQDASRAVGRSFEDLWRRVDDSRLQNRTRDEIGAWVIMGVLVAGVACMLTTLKSSGAGKLGRLLLALTGAFIGGMVVHAGRIDFGLGPVLIRYEELLFSFGGAALLLIVIRLLRSRTNKKSTQK